MIDSNVSGKTPVKEKVWFDIKDLTRCNCFKYVGTSIPSNPEA